MKGSVSPAQHLLRISAKTTGTRISGPPSVQSHNNELFIVVMTTTPSFPLEADFSIQREMFTCCLLGSCNFFF